jgi:hypothetical protein
MTTTKARLETVITQLEAEKEKLFDLCCAQQRKIVQLERGATSLQAANRFLTEQLYGKPNAHARTDQATYPARPDVGSAAGQPTESGATADRGDMAGATVAG